MVSTRRFRTARALTILGICAVRATSLGAQTGHPTLLNYTAASEYEDYLRALQVAGLVKLYPWSIRSFSPREIRELTAGDSAGPWRQSVGLDKRNLAVGPLTLRETFNSAYPYGANDGPVWAGRGLTSSVTAGVAASIGPVSITLAPMAFRAENRPFALLNNGLTGTRRFANGTESGTVDYPQRFGDGAYSVIDPGNTSIRFDSRQITFGISTANEWIGPATEYPFLLSNNAAGFPHLFVGTGEPVNLWLASVHSRFAWGKLDQSDYSPVSGSTRYLSPTQSGTIRLATYGEVVLIPRGVPGLELGVARFFHVPFRVGEPRGDFWKKPFHVFFLKNEYASGDFAGADNQLASAFFRWVFPNSGFELFGERGYEDQFYDVRDLIQRPDHEREYMLGFQKVLAKDSARLDVLRAELVNYQYPAGTIYLHSTLRQGHTNRGQLLGASAGVGTAAASTISWTRYTPGARTAATLRRIVRDENGDFLSTGTADPRSEDVILAAGLERMHIGNRADFGVKIEGMQDFNRNFSRDVPNLNLQITTRLKSW